MLVMCGLIFILAFSVKSEHVMAQALTNNLTGKSHTAAQLSTKAELPKANAPLSFIENKGQVTDQNRQPRTDIQFSVAAAEGLNIFIGNGAIHYQFCKNNNPHPAGNDLKKSPTG